MKILCGRVCYPWVMIGEFEDGYSYEMGGNDIGDCLERLSRLEAKHGEMTWYGGLNDEEYVDGEYIGSDRATMSSRRLVGTSYVRGNQSPEGTLLYRNKQNENKYIEVKKSKDGHTWFRQFMYWNTDDGSVKNYSGSKTNRGRFHRVRQDTLNSILEDYEQVDDVHTDMDVFESVSVMQSSNVDNLVDTYFDRVSWDELCDFMEYDGPEEGPSTTPGYDLDHIDWLLANEEYYDRLADQGQAIAELVSDGTREFIAYDVGDRVYEFDGFND